MDFDAHLKHDGRYWVAKVPALGLCAADPEREVALDDIWRMVQAQVMYARAKDPTFSFLFRPGFEHLRDAARTNGLSGPPNVVVVE